MDMQGYFYDEYEREKNERKAKKKGKQRDTIEENYKQNVEHKKPFFEPDERRASPLVAERREDRHRSKKNRRHRSSKSRSGSSSSPSTSKEKKSPRRHQHQHHHHHKSSSVKRDKENKKNLEFKWENPEVMGSIPPSEYTITHINQNYDILVSYKHTYRTNIWIDSLWLYNLNKKNIKAIGRS